jgi:glycosyltransferase involved in cell wall biosynthesis
MRVIFIARYRDATMERKLHYLAAMKGLSLRQVHPAEGHADVRPARPGAVASRLDQLALPMVGRVDDPHRAVYRTVTFGLRQFRPDIIHAEEEPDSLAALQITLARRLFAPQAKLILFTWQNIDRERRPEVRWVTRQTLRAADAVLCGNREAQSILARQRYPGYTEVLPANGVDTDNFRPCAERPVQPNFVIGYIGRLAPEKGIHVLLEALAQLGTEFELRLMGDGREGPALLAQSRALGLGNRVQFIPARPPAQVAEYMCHLDALVLPSLTTAVWKEQFGRVLTEAMACRVPVVGSNSGAITEVVDQAGLIFPEGDAAALADCLRRLHASRELRRELADKGEARVRDLYTQAVIAQKTAAVYQKLLNRNASAQPA